MNSEDIYVYDPAFEDYPSSEDSDLPGCRASSDPSTLQNSLESFASDPNIVSALNENIDLTEYGITLDEKLTVAEGKAVEQYSAKGDDLEDLQSSIDDCDATLSNMQEMLLGFQADLGGISEEIKSLQEESMSMNVKLRNRKAAEHRISSFLKNIVISPDLATTICNGDVSKEYLDYVVELDRKHKYVNLREPADDGSSADIGPASTVAGREMRSHIDKLRLKAVEKTRDYFLSKISELRKAKTNVRMIQTSSLLQYASLMKFLDNAAPDVHNEIRDVYVESMSKVLSGLFKTYQSQLAKLDLKAAGKNDLIAVEEAAVKDMFSSKVNMSKKIDPFTLGERGKVLEIADERPIMVHIAIAEGEKFPYEMLFRSIVKHLMDAATNEYVFTNEFFTATPSRDVFNNIFTKTLSLVLENLENYLFNSHDAIGLLLMIRLTHVNRKIMRDRGVNVLDNLFDRINMILWPRLKNVFDNNLKSLKAATQMPKKLGAVDLHAHYISRRYAEFSSSILALVKAMEVSKTQAAAEGGQAARFGGKEMLKSDMANLTEAMTKMLMALANQHATSKNKIVFLINNYDSIACVLAERKVEREEVVKFEEKLNQQREQFVEEELRQSYARLISFVQQTESQASKRPEIDQALVENLVRQFSSSWKAGIEQINKNVLSYFSNFRNGMEILKQVLTQLLLYYTRFQDIIRKAWKKPPPFTRDLVSTSAILAEIKKYALAI
ncbi:hypothetical protein TrLO_g9568 [Triparma laevis f. longispina]|uniref:Uncharacterized protein n=1 Tax=Triparma laevis f. longispina TaxID=1714387 RepID=A0A9W6ZE33_9STRA|nr:hypothetical protein TrLO_g9568 [Triparma laevis f. longispina]